MSFLRIGSACNYGGGGAPKIAFRCYNSLNGWMDIYSTFPYLCAFVVRAARTQTSAWARPEIFLKKPTTERDGPSQDETQIRKKKNEPIHQRWWWWCWPGPLGSFRPRGVSKVDKSSFDCETLFSESFPPPLSLWRNSRLSLSCIYYVLFQIPCSFFSRLFRWSLTQTPAVVISRSLFFWLKWRAVNLSSFLDLNQQHGGGCCMARCCCCVSPGAQDIYPFYFFFLPILSAL